MRKCAILAVLVMVLAVTCQAAPVALFYMTNSSNSVEDFMEHSRQIDLLVPTWYNVDGKGAVTGEPNLRVLERAKREKLPVAPIVALFDHVKFHQLATNAEAQDRMNQAFVNAAKKHGYVGFQIDFEEIDVADRDLLSALVAKTAAAMHENHLQLSIATVPNMPGHAEQTDYSKWMFASWRGGYDLAALAKSVDLICLMTYDQHTRLTTPGPVTGWQWTIDNLDYALKFVPASKLSLGIPIYGYHWYTKVGPNSKGVDKPRVSAATISAPHAVKLAESFQVKPQWDEQDHTAFYYFNREQLREWVFYTDARTFTDRYALTEKYGLQGFCSWVLGEEDQSMWKALPVRAK